MAGGDADLAAYRVYWDSGTGVVDYNTPLDEVTAIGPERRTNARPDSGTGTGRVSVWGEYRGASRNETWAVEVTAAGIWQLDSGSGLDGIDRDILLGFAYVLPGGPRVAFVDDPGDYEVGDRWEFRLGVETGWMSEEMDPGTYLFGVTAVDEAGNESAVGVERTVTVDPRPRPPSNIVGAWDDNYRVVALNWDASPDVVDGYRIYSNWRTNMNELAEAVLEDGPIMAREAVATDADVVLGGSGDPGTLLFYVRSVDSRGRECGNATLVRVECAGTLTSVVSAPEMISVEAAAGGTFVLTWLQDRNEGDPVSVWIYSNTTASWAGATLRYSGAYSGGANQPSEHTWTTGVFASPTWFAVMAIDAAGAQAKSGWVLGTPDGTAPGTPVVDRALPT